MEKSVLLQGHASLNRAVDGDLVAVELLPESMWTAPSGIVLEDQEDQDPGPKKNDLIYSTLALFI